MIQGMISMPKDLPDDPVLLKQLLAQMLSEPKQHLNQYLGSLRVAWNS